MLPRPLIAADSTAALAAPRLLRTRWRVASPRRGARDVERGMHESLRAVVQSVGAPLPRSLLLGGSAAAWQLEVVQLQDLREAPPEVGERSVVVFMSTSLEKDIKELRLALQSVDRCV